VTRPEDDEIDTDNLRNSKPIQLPHAIVRKEQKVCHSSSGRLLSPEATTPAPPEFITRNLSPPALKSPTVVNTQQMGESMPPGVPAEAAHKAEKGKFKLNLAGLKPSTLQYGPPIAEEDVQKGGGIQAIENGQNEGASAESSERPTGNQTEIDLRSQPIAERAAPRMKPNQLQLNLNSLAADQPRPGFHEEFMSRLDEFSLSWRLAAAQEKKF
jgi:hypothetical protein